MLKDENDIIDIPTELEIEETEPEVETLENLEVEEPEMLTTQIPVEAVMEQLNEEPVITEPETSVETVAPVVQKPDPVSLPEEQTAPIAEPVAPVNELIAQELPVAEPINPVVNEEPVTYYNAEQEKLPDVPEVIEPTTPFVDAVSNNELNGISLTNLEQTQSIGALDGNPDSLDIKVKGIDDKEPKKKKINIKIIIIIFAAITILGVSGFLYYNYLVGKKDKPVEKEPLLQVVELSIQNSFDEAYKKVSATFDVIGESQKLKYEVKDGKISITKGEQNINATIKDVNISFISVLKQTDKIDVLGLKDNQNNYYFVEISHNIEKDVELDYQNNKLLTILNDDTIENIAIAEHLNNKGYFYLAEKSGENLFIEHKDGAVTKISDVQNNVYNGINIDFQDLNLNSDVRKKIKIDGIGLFYDGTLYMYKGKGESINEIEVLDAENHLNVSKLYLAYREDLKYFDLYVITEEKVLYQINLLTQEFDETKINLVKKENAVIDHLLVESGGVSYLEITLDNNEKISVK